ncbi:MAG: hypothetical protein FWC95_03965 [Defluviitaleaceae bacterium]|nr:hypothetical protein [Defluviitaleaceae bacterium]
MQERVDDFVIKHSKISRARLKELILSTDNIAVEMGTVLVGQEAVREGLIDRVGNLNDAKYIIS